MIKYCFHYRKLGDFGHRMTLDIQRNKCNLIYIALPLKFSMNYFVLFS